MKDLATPSVEQQFQLLTFLHRVYPGRSPGVLSSAVSPELVDAFRLVMEEAGLGGVPSSPEPGELLLDPARIGTASIEHVVALLSLVLQRERSAPGFLANKLKDGVVFALLRRLRQVICSGPELTARIKSSFDEYCRMVESSAPLLIDRPGSIMYSPPDTLQRARLMLMGTNPGNEPEPWTATIREELEFRRRNTDYHAYVQNLTGDDHQLSRSLQAIVQMGGFEMRQVPAFNLMPTPTKKADSTNYPAEALEVWPAHLFAIKIIQPEMIICLGNGGKSPYHLLRDYGLHQPCEAVTPLYGTFSIKLCKGKVGGVELAVLGLPHPSRCRGLPERKELAEAMRAILR